MTSPEERPELIGWTVITPAGEIVATGGQTGLEAAADTGDEDGSN